MAWPGDVRRSGGGEGRAEVTRSQASLLAWGCGAGHPLLGTHWVPPPPGAPWPGATEQEAAALPGARRELGTRHSPSYPTVSLLRGFVPAEPASGPGAQPGKEKVLRGPSPWH